MTHRAATASPFVGMNSQNITRIHIFLNDKGPWATGAEVAIKRQFLPLPLNLFLPSLFLLVGAP